MAILKFRIYLEEDDSIYRDIVIKHKQTFYELHTAILKAYEFHSKHRATFYRSNDNWQYGREISLEKYSDVTYKVAPLIMEETVIGTEIIAPNQHFIYLYDFEKKWNFLIELINISKEENPKIDYPSITRKEGIGPQQYGIKGLFGPKFADVEEKYDLSEAAEGFGNEGDGQDSDDDNDSYGADEEQGNDDY